MYPRFVYQSCGDDVEAKAVGNAGERSAMLDAGWFDSYEDAVSGIRTDDLAAKPARKKKAAE